MLGGSTFARLFVPTRLPYQRNHGCVTIRLIKHEAIDVPARFAVAVHISTHHPSLFTIGVHVANRPQSKDEVDLDQRSFSPGGRIISRMNTDTLLFAISLVFVAVAAGGLLRRPLLERSPGCQDPLPVLTGGTLL